MSDTLNTMQFNTEAPTRSAVYLVDRGMQGKLYRWYNAETNVWALCGADFAEAAANKDKPSPVGFFPWIGPLTGPKFDPNKEVYMVNEDSPPVKQPKAAKPAKKMARQRTSTSDDFTKARLIITKVGNTTVGSIVKGTKVTHPDGTVFFREDRQKWVAMMNGKQEAARPTAEACVMFLKKKYNIEAIILNKD